MSEKEIKLQNSEGIPTDLKVSSPNGEKIIIQPAQRYEDKLVGAVLENTAGTGLGIVLTVTGAVLAIRWLGLPEALKTFLDIQRNTSESISKLAQGVQDLIKDHEKSLEDIAELKSDVKDIREDITEMKYSVSKCPNTK